MYNTHFKNSAINIYMSLYCFHTLQRKQTLQKFLLHGSISDGSYAFFANVHLFVLSNKDNEFKTVVGGILLPLDTITMLCKRHTVLQDSLTPTILNVVIISATELGPPAQFKFIVVSLSKIPSKILQLHEMLQTFRLFLKTVRPG